MLDGRGDVVHEAVGVLDALGQGQRVYRLRVVVRGQAVHLLDVKSGVSLREGNFPLDVVASVVGLRARDAVRVDHK